MKLTLTHNPRYVNLFPRLIAAGIDGLIGGVFFAYTLNTLSTSSSISSLLPALLQMTAYILIPVGVGYGVALVALLAWTGYTPGKWLCGIQVLTKDEQPLGFLTALIREWLAKRVSAAIVMVGYVAMVIDSNHQTWHDEMVSSFAYKRTGNLMVGMLVFIALLGVESMLLYSVWVHVQTNTGLQQDIQFLIAPLLQMIKK